jgi:SAM-dependent methyltransferase
MSKTWTADQLLQMAGAYQAACVLSAAADLELFSALAGSTFTAADAAQRLDTDLRATTILLDALAALELLDKSSGRYSVPASVARLMDGRQPGNVLAMAQHQGNCMRRWVQLANVVQTGQPAQRVPSVRGQAADSASFIEAMDNISSPIAPQVVGDLALPPFHHLLDVGGASGTWTLAFLRANSQATATIFDLPHVMPQAQARLAASGLAHRVKLVSGDFYVDPLPAGADLVWLGAIVHQNSRQQNRDLFIAVHRALLPGGHVLVRDIVMEESRTSPPSGAMFAINMLTGTAAGGTYTFAELRDDLAAAGLVDAKLLRKDPWMNSVIQARKS